MSDPSVIVSAAPVAGDRKHGPVAPALVHKQVQCEVLLSGYDIVDRVGTLHARWDRRDEFYRQAEGEYFSIGMALEMFRQSAVFMAHRMCGVELGSRFVMRRLTAYVDVDFLRVRQQAPEPTINIRPLFDAEARSGRRIDWEMTLWNGTEQVGTSIGELSVLHEDVYQSLRSTATDASAFPPAVALPAADLGRLAQRDIVVSGRGQPNNHVLLAPREHSTYFDHPLDHLPGMLLIEGACQASVHVAGQPRSIVTGVDARFFRFAEFAPSCELETRPAGSAGTQADYAVTIRQSDLECATVNLRMATP